MDLRLDGARLKFFDVARRPGANPDVNTVVISGPYNVTGRGDTPSRGAIFVCRPTTSSEEEPCARQILTGLARRAFRRPVREADVKPLLALYQKERRAADFDSGIRAAIQAMLVSPDFLFRIEQDPQAGKPSRQRARPCVATLLLLVEQHSRR